MMKKLYKIEYTGTAIVYIDEDFLPGLLSKAENVIKLNWSSGPEVVGFNGLDSVEMISNIEQVPEDWKEAIPVGGNNETCSDILGG
jgi:hypothetical protein